MVTAADIRQQQIDEQFWASPLGWAVRHWKAIVAVVLTVYLVFASAFSVQQYERGVVTTWGKLSYVASPGLGFKVPIMQSVTIWRVDGLAFRIVGGKKDGQDVGVNTYTIDNQEVDIIATVQYRVDPDKVAFVYENFQNYVGRLTESAVSRLKSEMGKVNATHVAENRAKIEAAVEAILKRDANTLGITVTSFQLTNIEYTPAFRKAVSDAATEKAKIDQREYERQQAEKTAQRQKIEAEGAANAAREKAKGEADAIDVVAKASANKIRLEGEATALAMKAQANALSANPVLVEMKKAEQWNGQLPQQILSGVVPFMNYQPAALQAAKQ